MTAYIESNASQLPQDDSLLIASYRSPSPHQSRSQYYEVLNHFFADGVRIRRRARFKRIGDKRGWGAPEWREGLEVDRARFYEWHIPEAGARLNELAGDGCEIVSYKKPDPPHGMVTYLLVSWPTNAELEHNRSIRTAKKRPKPNQLPQSAAPFQRPRTQIAAGDPAPGPGPESDFMRRRGEEEAREMPLFAAVRP